jgi:DNA topoisomerase-3
LCEKPSVAKDFAAALDCTPAKKGVYQNGNTVITHCIGHLFALCPPEAYDPAYKTWRLEDLPIIPERFRYEMIKETKEQTAVVLSLLKAHKEDEILIATDAGREGELIAREALLMAGVSDKRYCRRFWVSEALTPAVIKAGIRAAKPLAEYDRIGAEGFARQRADWLAGMNLSRYMSIGNPASFSVGRVQTAVLRAVADRNDAAAHFTPVPYRELAAEIRDQAGEEIAALLVDPKSQKTAFFDSFDFLQKVKEYCEGKNIDKAETETAGKTQKPEKLLNITGLQKAAYKRFGYTPARTLDIAQALYEQHKCLSYPRTPSRVMGDNNVDLFRQKFDLLKDNFPQASKFCDVNLITRSNRHIFNSAALEDHHALIPLNILPAAADAAERNVYTIVAEAFFRVCMPDYVFEEKRLRLFCGEFLFTASIKKVLQAGWKASIKNEEKDDGAQESDTFDERNCRIMKTEILQRQTAPPAEYSQDTLLAFMENPHNTAGEKLAGLGTPATRADILRKLFAREYLFEKGKKLFAGEKGLFLLRQLQRDETLAKIADVSQTTVWEAELARDPRAFEASVQAFVRACIKIDAPRETFEKAAVGKCPVCGNKVLEGAKSFYCGGYKGDPPCRFSIWKEVCGAKVTAADAAALLAGKKTGVKKCVSKAGKDFAAKFYLDKDGKVAFDFAAKQRQSKGS